MKIDKEYPATHSMYTSWFAVDDEGHVALIEIEDDGPIPFGKTNDEFPDEIVLTYWNDKEGKKMHNLEPEDFLHVDEFPEGFPSYAYHVYEGSSEDGAYREICPEHPLKISDFGNPAMEKEAWHIPGNFKDKPMLQLLRYFPCETHYSGVEYNGNEYVRMKDEDGVIKYFRKDAVNETISETAMSELIKEGKAKPFD